MDIKEGSEVPNAVLKAWQRMGRLNLYQLSPACCPRAELRSLVVRVSLGCRVRVQMACPNTAARAVMRVNNRAALTRLFFHDIL